MRETSAATEAADTKSVQQRMLDRDFGVATFKYNRWAADLTEAQSLEDALDPRFWANQAEKIMGHDRARPKGRGDIIELRKLDTGLFAELLVTEVGTGFIKVELLRAQEPKSVEIGQNIPFETKWNVGKRSHEVIRKADKQVMAGGFQSKNSAAKWIADHMQAMTA